MIIDAPSTMLQGAAAQATAYAVFTDGSRQDLALAKCRTIWSSSAPEVAGVSETGWIEAVGLGRSTISMSCDSLHAEKITQILRAYRISGLIKEKYGHVPIPGATARIVSGGDQGREVLTDGEGRFVLSNLTTPVFKLLASAPDFETDGGTVSVEQTEPLTIELEPLFSELRWAQACPPPAGCKKDGADNLPFHMSHVGPVELTISSACFEGGTYETLYAAVVERPWVSGTPLLLGWIYPTAGAPNGSFVGTGHSTLAPGSYYLSVQYLNSDTHSACNRRVLLRHPR